MSTVIKIENLSKYYRLGLIGGGTLREDVDRWVAKIKGQPDPLFKVDETHRRDGEIWALKDINLEVKEGEILGIIGRNGAGKSTLLKILSRITAPTRGQIKIKGRVGSLLEVGTGFHPELTGRENIYLNGAILGMNRAEVTRKLDEIIDFAGVEKFVDTPVKRYSSGMTVRLAFAVAAHLEPEILIIDEVLAVGDAAFQKKCLGKMQDVAGQGRTVLFVSHNMATIKSLCPSSILFTNGKLVLKGDTADVIDKYTADVVEQNGNRPQIFIKRLKNKMQNSHYPIILNDLKILDREMQPALAFDINEQIIVEYYYEAREKISSCAFGLSIKNSSDVEVLRLSTWPISGVEIFNLEGNGKIQLIIGHLNLTGGDYYISVYCSRPNIENIWHIDNIAHIQIKSSDYYESGFPIENQFGILVAKHSWDLCK